MAHAEFNDLLKFGLIPELIGRLPVVAPLQELTEEAMLRILVEPKNAVTKQYQRLFEMEKQKLVFSDEALREVVRIARQRKTGARALRGIVEESLMDTMFELPSRNDVKEILVTPATIRQERRPRLKLKKPRNTRALASAPENETPQSKDPVVGNTRKQA